MDLWGEGAGGAWSWGRSSVPGGTFWWLNSLSSVAASAGSCNRRDPAPSSVSALRALREAAAQEGGAGVWGVGS